MLVCRQPAEQPKHRADVAQQVNNAAVQAAGRAAADRADLNGQMLFTPSTMNIMHAEQAVKGLIDYRLESACKQVVSHG
jgi:hypothetical protein